MILPNRKVSHGLRSLCHSKGFNAKEPNEEAFEKCARAECRLLTV